jgi:hypothetical protein
MGFKSGNTEIGKANSRMSLPSLSQQDCLLLLDIIRKSSFKGENMEKMFNLTLKLQNIFVILKELDE